MKIKIIFIIIFLFSNSVFGQQTIKGLLIDAETKEKIPFASIGVQNTNVGTISNSEGYFELSFTKNNKLDSVYISHLSYQYQTKETAQFHDTTLSIYLIPKYKLIEEVTVTSIPVSEILFDAVDNSQKNITLPIVLNTYYREFVKRNDKYSKFSDGLLDFFIKGKPNKLKSYVEVKESRAVELNDTNDDITSIYPVQRAVSLYNQKKILDKFLDKKNVENYIYNLRYEKTGSVELKIIEVFPKVEVHEPLFRGIITIDPKANLILKIEYALSDSHKKYEKDRNFLVAKMKILELKTIVHYKISKNNYTLLYTSKEASLKIWNKNNRDIFGFKSELITTDFKADKINFDTKNEYKKRSLYKRGNKYKNEFWKNNNAIQLTKREKDIIKSLNK